MKEKWYRLTNRHRWIPVAATFVLLVLLWIPNIVLGFEDGEMTFFFITWCFILLCSFFVGSANGSQLMNHRVLYMHNFCDPYPLVQECDDQLSYVKNKGNRQMLTINRAAALIALDYNADALASLEALNIDEPYCLPLWRYCYYHNLASAALACGEREKALVYRQKADQTAATITKKKEKDVVQRSTYDWLTELCLQDGDYAGAAHHLSYQTAAENPYQSVHRAFSIARIEMGCGNLANARLQLEFVMQYGNRLAMVAKAAALLAQMDGQEEK